MTHVVTKILGINTNLRGPYCFTSQVGVSPTLGRVDEITQVELCGFLGGIDCDS